MQNEIISSNQNQESTDSKKSRNYGNAALFSAILLIFFGFGFGFVNIAFSLFAIVLTILGLIKNKSNIKGVKIKCISAIIIVGIMVILYFAGFCCGLINFLINDLSIKKIDEITKPLFK